jgi:hypothetical protein
MDQTTRQGNANQPSTFAQQDELAARQQLGERVGYYPSQTGRVVGKLLLGIFVTLAGLFLLLLTIGVLTQPPSDTGDSSGGTPVGLVIFGFLFAGLLLWVGIKESISACQNLGASIYLYRGGFIRTRWGNSAPVHWNQVKELQQSVTRRYRRNRYTGNTKYVGTTYMYTLRTIDGKKFIFRNGIKDVENLGDQLSQEITRTLLPKAIMAYQAGQNVTFGSFTVSPGGVSNGYETLSWDVIESITANAGNIYIRTGGRSKDWAKVKSVPNVPVLLALVNYIAESRKARNIRTS